MTKYECKCKVCENLATQVGFGERDGIDVINYWCEECGDGFDINVEDFEWLFKE